MKSAFAANIAALCCVLSGCLCLLNAADANQFAYISSSQGISEYRVYSDGSLKTLQTGLNIATPNAMRLFIDPTIRTLLAVDDTADSSSSSDGLSDRIHIYKIDKEGKLLPQITGAVVAGLAVQKGAYDFRLHFLYLLGVHYPTCEEELVVYNVSRPSHPVKRQTVVFPEGEKAFKAEDIFEDTKNASLFLLGSRTSFDRVRSVGELQRYNADPTADFPLKCVANYAVDVNLLIGMPLNQHLVFGDSANQLVTYKFNAKAGVSLSARTLIPKTVTGVYPWGMAYRAVGSFLYVGLYNMADSARSGTQPSTVVAYHISKAGQFSLLKTASTPPVVDPQPFLDKSGRYLYVISQGSNRLDAYKIGSDGKLSRPFFHLQIEQPTKIVFM